MEIIEEYELQDKILERSIYDELNEAIDEFISDVLGDFTNERGIGSNGYGIASEVISDFFEDAGDIGKEETGILDLYMLAFKLAKEQLN